MSDTPVKIVFLDADTFWPTTRVRPPSFAHEMTTYDRTAPEETAARIADADIVITNKVRISKEALDGAPRLKMIAVAATGYDIIDVEACRARDVVVSNIRGYATTTVPEHVFALIFALRRSLCAYREAVLAGRWQEANQFCFFDYPIADLAGSTLGVVGAGALGGRVAEIGKALGMEVLLSGRKGETAGDGRVAFEDMLARADIISLHCPLTPQTQNLLGAAEFAAMKRRPILINTARGALIDIPALAEALDKGQVSAAGVDVAAKEPPLADDPLMALARRPNVVVTPHVGWASHEAVQVLADQLIDNVEAFVAGEPRNRVA